MNSQGCCHTAKTGRPQDVLMEEHRVIERVLAALERMLDSGAMDVGFVRQCLDFFRNFADGCHHAKEENALFPALERAGIPRLGGPVGVMLHEHTEGRQLLGIIADHLPAADVDKRAAYQVRAAARSYIGLLREHIAKEDNVLFVMADRVLAPDTQRAVLESFEELESAEGKAGEHERFLRLAEELEKREFNVSPQQV